MARRKRWPDEAETQRIESIAIFSRIIEISDDVFAAIETDDLEHAVELLAGIKYRAAKGRYMLTNLINIDDEDDVAQ